MGSRTKTVRPPRTVFYCDTPYIDTVKPTVLALSHRKDGGKMNGLGILITVLFCTIIWWGTSRYYIQIIKDINQAWERNFDLITKDKYK